MKTSNILLLCCATLFLSLSAFAQTYHPFLNNSSWVVKVSDITGSTDFVINQGIDTVIGSYTYKKFVNTHWDDKTLREDIATKKVYVRKNNTDQLLFDFSLQLGQHVFLTANAFDFMVTNIDSINVVGGKRKRIEIRYQGASSAREVWIEGVGNQNHPLVANFEQFSDPVYNLQCSFQNGTSIYNNGLAYNVAPTNCLVSTEDKNLDFQNIKIVPNPFSVETFITTERPFNNASLYLFNSVGQLIKTHHNLNGQQVALQSDNLTNGLYFIKITENGQIINTNKIVINH